MAGANGVVEIRWHGRGGQGAVTSAELLARAAIDEGKFAQAFPSFGPERRGAPVLAFDRISENEPVRVRADIREPDYVTVLDPGLLTIVNVTSGLKEGGFVIVNTKKSMKEIEAIVGANRKIAIVNATKIARELLGVPIVNTTMLGAIIKVSGLVKMESLLGPLTDRFGKLTDRNYNAMKKAYEETVVKG